MISTTYIHKKLSYYFTRNQLLDLQIGSSCKMSINKCIDILQQSISINTINNNSNNTNTNTNSTFALKYKLLQSCLCILDHLIISPQPKPISNNINTSMSSQQKTKSQNSQQVHLDLSINPNKYIQFYQNDGIRCCVFALKGYLDYLTNTPPINSVSNTGNISNNNNHKTGQAQNQNQNNSNNSSNINSNTASVQLIKITIIDQMIIKSLMNILYTGLYCYCQVYQKINEDRYDKNDQDQIQLKLKPKPKPNLQSTSTYKSKSKSKSKQTCMKILKQLIQQLQLDNLLIRMVTLTLQVYYLPIKKLVMLYTRVLSILFYDFKDFIQKQKNRIKELVGYVGYVGYGYESMKENNDSSNSGNVLNKQDKCQIEQDLYTDAEMLKLSQKNQLSQNYLKQFRQKNKPEDIKFLNKSNPIQHFYSKHNVGDCPLAQSIVVGLLRSLLTICNSQMHKKFQASPSKGSGADSYREWQISYQFFMQCDQLPGCKNYQECLSSKSMAMLKDYMQYNQLASQGAADKVSANVASIPTHFQFYRHKIYTTSAISTFFTFLLVSFKKNAMIQFTYLYQLISDANGILVFLKFLTDKFQYLEPVAENIGFDKNREQNKMSLTSKNTSKNFLLTFKNQVMLTVYSVLMVLYGACNNYAEKTRSYLFEYNSYLIIKKIPHIFMKVHKNDDELPSQQQIQAQFGKSTLNVFKRSSQQQNTEPILITEKVKQLTQLCYSLLKIQIPFFSKKMKQNANNMKMIVQIYCQMPKKIQPIKRTELDKLLLKNQMRKIHHQKYILSVQELKSIHNQYNNIYYWSNQEAKINEANEKNAEIVQAPLTMTKEEMQNWLEQNVWKFYD